MPVPHPAEAENTNKYPGGVILPGGGYTDNYVIGFWWSNADWQWWPYYLGEAREATGNPNLTAADAKSWANANGFNLANSIPVTGRSQPPDDDSFIYDDSGRAPARPGSGNGRTATPEVYESPDVDALRDQIKAYVVATTGTARSSIIEGALKKYLDADKSEFDRQVGGGGGEQISAMQSVKEYVRGTADYQTLHELRPESVDEMEWITSRQGLLRQLGLSSQRAETLGVKQAQAGANSEAVVGAAEMQNVADTGRLLATQKARIKQSASAALGLM